MNNPQELWWKQAKSDHDTFGLLLKLGIAPCHSLHYLQMATEKLAKAYFWRSGTAPRRSHVGFVPFLRALANPFRQKDGDRIAKLFLFNRSTDFQNWFSAVAPIAYDLERVTPDLANDGPNPEYPWPHAEPQHAPVEYEFPVWTSLTSSRGRDLMRFIRIAVDRFPDYADT